MSSAQYMNVPLEIREWRGGGEEGDKECITPPACKLYTFTYAQTCQHANDLK